MVPDQVKSRVKSAPWTICVNAEHIKSTLPTDPWGKWSNLNLFQAGWNYQHHFWCQVFSRFFLSRRILGPLKRSSRYLPLQRRKVPMLPFWFCLDVYIIYKMMYMCLYMYVFVNLSKACPPNDPHIFCCWLKIIRKWAYVGLSPCPVSTRIIIFLQ